MNGDLDSIPHCNSQGYMSMMFLNNKQVNADNNGQHDLTIGQAIG